MKFSSKDNNELLAIYECNMCDAQQGTAIIEIEPDGPIGVEQGEGEHEVLYSDVKKLVDASTQLLQMINSVELEEWMIAELTVASANVSKIYHLLDSKNESEVEEVSDVATFANMAQQPSVEY